MLLIRSIKIIISTDDKIDDSQEHRAGGQGCVSYHRRNNQVVSVAGSRHPLADSLSWNVTHADSHSKEESLVWKSMAN